MMLKWFIGSIKEGRVLLFQPPQLREGQEEEVMMGICGKSESPVNPKDGSKVQNPLSAEGSEESKVLQQIKEIIHDPSDLNTHESFERIKYLMEEHGFATESFAAKEGNYKLGNYADYEILELDTHSYLMSVGHSESEAEDLIERYEAFIEVGFENGDSPYEIGISITENERLDNEAESFNAEAQDNIEKMIHFLKTGDAKGLSIPWEYDNQGQVVIYTGCTMKENEEVIEMTYCEQCGSPEWSAGGCTNEGNCELAMNAESFEAVPISGTGSSGQMCDVCNESDDLPYDSDHFKECGRCNKSVCHECWDEMESDENYYEICGECWTVLDNVAQYDAESFEAGEWGHGHGLSNIGIESCRKRLAIAEYVLSMSDAVQFYNDTLLQELGIDRYADDFEAEKKNCGCGQDPCVTYGAEIGEILDEKCDCGSDLVYQAGWACVDGCGEWYSQKHAESFDAEKKNGMELILADGGWEGSMVLSGDEDAIKYIIKQTAFGEEYRPDIGMPEEWDMGGEEWLDQWFEDNDLETIAQETGWTITRVSSNAVFWGNRKGIIVADETWWGAESFEAEGCDHDWAITCIKCETRLRDLGDEI